MDETGTSSPNSQQNVVAVKGEKPSLAFGKGPDIYQLVRRHPIRWNDGL